MPDDLGERTEEATPKRRLESRQEGQVAKSQDLSGAALLAVGTVTIAVAALWMFEQGRVVMDELLGAAFAGDALDPEQAIGAITLASKAALRAAAPLALVLWLTAALAQLGQVGWLFAPNVLRPQLRKLNPAAGFRRVFGVSGLVKAGLDSLKVAVVIVIAVHAIRQDAARVLVMPYGSMLECAAIAGQLMLDLAIRILVVLLLLGVIDLAYQRWKQSQDLKMTKQQIKDEMKQTDGDPEVKRRRLRMQQQIAMQRIASAVPKADVVVTNPEHFAVAIRYEAEKMHAPKVIAKGADHLALRIRQIALRHGIPIVERKPLARALYRDVAVGQEVPPDFYAAVAEVLAYVYRLDGRKAG